MKLTAYAHRKRAKSSGWTLIEIITTLAVLCILIPVGNQSFSAFIESSQASAIADALHSALTKGRLIAIQQHKYLTLCPIAEGECNKNWNNEIALFHDENKNKQLDENEEVIQRIKPARNKFDIAWRGFGAKRYITFKSNGLYRRNGSFHICPLSGRQPLQRRVIVNISGRVKVQRNPDCDDINNL